MEKTGAHNKPDRRSERTRQLVSGALIALLLEKPYDAITVQDIVERANVGRSTFYAHYQDKDDLLANQFRRLVEELGQRIGDENSECLLPSLELFRHVQQHYPLYKAIVIWGRGLDFISKTLQTFLSQTVENQLERRLAGQPEAAIPLPVAAHYVTGAFLTLLKWWLENNMLYSPEVMDEFFQQLTLPGVQAALNISL